MKLDVTDALDRVTQKMNAVTNFTTLPPGAPPDMFVASTGGLRDNKKKAKLALVPSSTARAIAEVIFRSSTDGGGKYPMHNWKKGLPWTGVAESALRHIHNFLDRQDIDAESGLHTLKHALCNLSFLVEYLETHPEMDDRYLPPEGK